MEGWKEPNEGLESSRKNMDRKRVHQRCEQHHEAHMTNDTTRIIAERACIGAMLLEDRAIDHLIRIGGALSWFKGENERKAASAILMRHESGKFASNAIAIASDTGLPGEWLDGCIDTLPTATHVEYYGDLLKGHADIDAITAMRNKIDAAIRRATPDTAAELKAEIESSLHDALVNEEGGHVTLKQAAHEWLDRITDRSETVMLDWPVDKVTHSVGRIDTELIWIIAQPSVGKTAFCCQWASRLAARGHMSTIFSLESGIHSLVRRFLMEQGDIQIALLKDEHPSEHELDKARKVADGLSDLIRVVDTPMTIDQLYAAARAEKRRGSRLVMIDNTRHIRVPSIHDRVQAMAHICSRVKDIRDDTRMPVVVLHHSNKDDDVSWSSDVRRDADMLVFLRNVDAQEIDRTDLPQPSVVDVAFDVEKHREGDKGFGVVMRYDKIRQRFTGKYDTQQPARA